MLIKHLAQEAIVSAQKTRQDLPGGRVDGSLPASAEDMGSIPGPGGSHVLQGT